MSLSERLGGFSARDRRILQIVRENKALKSRLAQYQNSTSVLDRRAPSVLDAYLQQLGSDELRSLAKRLGVDPRTGFLTRAACFAVLEWLPQGYATDGFVVDVVNLKGHNAHSYKQGDKALADVSRALNSAISSPVRYGDGVEQCMARELRRTDLLVRWGGDELVVLPFPKIPEEKRFEVEDRLNRSLAYFSKQKVYEGIGLAVRLSWFALDNLRRDTVELRVAEAIDEAYQRCPLTKR
ncbi:diguanylate cyclase [Candidatus Woesearchaeota archaeon]|nr:MAG: diguanylate cyclase [Candidatus Woesearchaeota archaeon]